MYNRENLNSHDLHETGNNQMGGGNHMNINKLQLGAVPLSQDVLSKANIGMWAFELDEGKPPRMYVDDTMLGLVGLKEQVPPEETYHAWYDNVDPGSYDLVNDAVDKMINGEHAEVQYPWHHPDGHTVIVRCGGVRNPEYKQGVRVEGTHQDITEMLHFDQEKQAKEQRDFSLLLINSLSDSYSTLYYVEPMSGKYQYVSNNDEFDRLVESRMVWGNDFYDDLSVNIPLVVYEEDRELVRKFFIKEHFIRMLNEKGWGHLDYRLVVEGAPVWYRLKFTKVMDKDGTERCVIGVMSLAAVKEQEEITRRNMDIIEILASEYSSVYYVNLKTNGLIPYSMNAQTEKSFGSVFKSGITYSEAFRLYVDKLVLAGDKEMMLKAGSLGRIMKELRTKKTYFTTYQNVDGHYCEMKFVKVGNEDGMPEEVALGFADKDAELRAQEEEEKVLQRNIDIIKVLASEYSSVYYIDMTTNELDTYTMNAQTETKFGKIFRSGIKYNDAFRMYVDTLVNEEDREKMMKAGSVYNICKQLGMKKTFQTSYRDTEGRHCEMKFVKVGEDENPMAVVLGFSVKNE